jgi:hypothetical protein
MKRLLALLLLSAACSAQSAQFSEEHSRALDQNPPGVKLTIETMPGRSSYRLSDEILFRLTFTSQKAQVYTIDTATGGNAAASTTDFIIEGPGLSGPIHSQPINARGFVCCGSERHYLSRSPVSISAQGISLKRLQLFGNGMPFPPLRRFDLKPGEYVIFAQTHNVMLGWPKTSHDAYHTLSDIVVTSSNVVHLTIVSDAP